MNKNLTELVFVLDRSGSMADLVQDTIGGFNGLIEKQRAEAGEARVTVVLFDHMYDVLYDGVDIRSIPPLNKGVYFARGSTALLDAVGKTIDAVGERLAATPEEQRPAKVIFAITTDGYENASKVYSLEKVKGMIEHQQTKYSWEFLFFGANIDAFGAAERIGISAARAMQFSADEAGISACYDRMSLSMSEMRSAGLGRRFEKTKGENDE